MRATQDRLYEVRQLQDYHAIEDPGFNINVIIPASGTEQKDGEQNVRVKAKELVDLIQVIKEMETLFLLRCEVNQNIYNIFFYLAGRR